VARPPQLTPEVLAEQIKELVRLAQDQGHLTHADVNETLAHFSTTAAQMDEVYARLRQLEIAIVDAAEVEGGKSSDAEEEEDRSRLDGLDDPVRMYLKQMGQVALLTREQEV